MQQERLEQLSRVGRELAAVLPQFSYDLIQLLESFAVEFRIHHTSSWHPNLMDLSVQDGVLYSLEAEKLYRDYRELHYAGCDVKGVHCGQNKRVWYYGDTFVRLVADTKSESDTCNKRWTTQDCVMPVNVIKEHNGKILVLNGDVYAVYIAAYNLGGIFLSSHALSHHNGMKICDFAVMEHNPGQVQVYLLTVQPSDLDRCRIVRYNWTDSDVVWSFTRSLPEVSCHPHRLSGKLAFFKNGQFSVVATSVGLWLLDRHFNVTSHLNFFPRAVCLSIDSDVIYTLNEDNCICQYLV